MIVRETEKEYPAIDLYELSRQIKVFLIPYSFVQSAHLYHGANKAKYHVIFKVPTVPEGWDKILAVPEESKTAAELYAKFYHDIQWPVLFNLHLDEVYHRGIGTKPLGPSPFDARPRDEWEWSIADGNNKILTGFYPVTSLGHKGAIEDLGLYDLVQSREGVMLYG